MAYYGAMEAFNQANALRNQSDMQGVQMLNALGSMEQNNLQTAQLKDKIARENSLRSILAASDPNALEPTVQALWRGGHFPEAQALRKQAQEMEQNKAFGNFFNPPAAQPAQPGMPQAGAQPGGAQPAQSGASGSPLDELDPKTAQTIRAMAASGDKQGALKHLFEALQPKMSSDGRAIITRGGKILAAPGAVEAYRAFQNETQAAQAQYGNPVTMDFNGGKIQVFPSEFESVRKGVLPERLGGPGPNTGFNEREMAAIKNDMLKSGISEATTVGAGPQGVPVRAQVTAPKIGMSLPENVQQANTEIAKKASDYYVQSADKARGAADTIRSLDQARQAIDNGAFMGSGAEYKLAIAKFANDVLGIPLDTNKASESDYLKSTLGARLLEQAKTLGSNPSNADAQRINDIVGSLSKDRGAMRKIIDWQESMAQRSITNHHEVRKRIENNDFTGALSVGAQAPERAPQRPNGGLPTRDEIEQELKRRGKL